MYRRKLNTGVLVDFGLAQLMPEGRVEQPPTYSKARFHKKGGTVPDDLRYTDYNTSPSIRASRAGTRGFRAPEVLFKVINQTTGINKLIQLLIYGQWV